MRGLNILGVLLVFVAVGALGFAGWYVYHSNHSPQVPSQKLLQRTPVSAKTATPKQLTLDDFQSIISNDKASVVKVEGAYGCGDLESFGTGFVVAPGLVATDAHVIAGYTAIYVHDNNGVHVATPMLFDANLDFGILRVSGLAGSPLPLNTSSSELDVLGSQNGSQDIVLGYPNGGEFTPVLASVSDEYEATTNGIYGNDEDAVMVQLKTEVIPGNSGSPLIQKDGSVTGIVFGTVPGDSTTGLAIPAHVFVGDVQRAKSVQAKVSTGECIPESGNQG